ncbi:hypothetical protein CERSUDRAFT_71120 [Gelatoporia subvermispora B]|uniref:RBR-type E3 ubiquitin transferase n=1 Tax=Ceriporiopsis subvermispora (strain B) TaxID=914234 RepID=M2RQY2_CERS8|nr:hypothetical protein CERSUDRAFT_71120 [Gelatoporia subvermispora B]
MHSFEDTQRPVVPYGREETIAHDVAEGRLEEYVVSHQGRSQYNGAAGGASACGLAALNCARVILGGELAGLQKDQLEVLRPCLSWSSFAHLEVEEIHQAPLFNQSLQLVRSEYGRSELDGFEELLGHLLSESQKVQRSACAVITRPPEILAVLHLGSSAPSTFVVFDSHPRPHKHPAGAAFIFFNSSKRTAAYLAKLLRYDAHLLMDKSMQWQAQLLAHYSGHIFVSSQMTDPSTGLTELALQSSIEILNLKAKLLEIESRDKDLKAENAQLTDEVSKLRGEVADLRDLGQRQRAWTNERVRPYHSYATAVSTVANSYTLSRPALVGDLSSTNLHSSGSRQQPSTSKTKGKQREQPPFSPTPSEMARHRDAELALMMQREYDGETARLSAQFSWLKTEVPEGFDCGICFEKYRKDAIATVPGCEHAFCRECLRQFVTTTVEQRRYPIACPICIAGREKADTGVIDGILVQDLGLTEEKYAIFIEMQLAKFSVIVHCRRCQNSTFVDKPEYEAHQIITCPLRQCGYTWCKACSQAIEIGGPQHSCDGSSELKHLMDQRGWKHCPGCQTPAEKIDGCNHMTCMAPGCNTLYIAIVNVTGQLHGRLEKLSDDVLAASEALKTWGSSEGDDLSDILSASALLYRQYACALTTFASHIAAVRQHMKAVRDKEEALDDLRRRQTQLTAKAESAHKASLKMKPNNSNWHAQVDLLTKLRAEIRALDAVIVAEKASLDDFKRISAKEWIGLKFTGMLECSLKGVIAGEVGKLVIQEVPIESTEPGLPRAIYSGYAQTEYLVSEAQRRINQVAFSPDPIPDLSHLDSRLPFANDQPDASTSLEATSLSDITEFGAYMLSHDAYDRSKKQNDSQSATFLAQVAHHRPNPTPGTSFGGRRARPLTPMSLVERSRTTFMSTIDEATESHRSPEFPLASTSKAGVEFVSGGVGQAGQKGKGIDDDAPPMYTPVYLMTPAVPQDARGNHGGRQLLEGDNTEGLPEFSCGICFDEHSLEEIATVPGCKHAFCRDCLRSFVVETVERRHYPISCPLCMTDTNSPEGGVIDESLMQQLGVTERQYAIFTEMQLSKYSIIVHCRRCQNSAFADKFEYDESEIITCPMWCGYKWCRSCSREVDNEGPIHSCDGSAEFTHLMSRRGWKHCPGCQTPAEKTEGCNHMTCMVPGCNTHYCYLCGERIICSVIRSDINEAVNTHYARCRLFEDTPGDRE